MKNKDDIYESNLLYKYNISDAWGMNYKRVEVYDGDDPYILYADKNGEQRIEITESALKKINKVIDKEYIDRNHDFGFAMVLDGYVNSFVLRKENCHYPIIVDNFEFLPDPKTEDAEMLYSIVKKVHKVLKKEGVREDYLELTL